MTDTCSLCISVVVILICHYSCAGPGDIDGSCGAMVSVDVLIGAIIGIILLAAVINVSTIITLLMYQKRR